MTGEALLTHAKKRGPRQARADCLQRIIYPCLRFEGLRSGVRQAPGTGAALKGRENGLFYDNHIQMIGDALREHLVIRHMMPAV